MYLEIKANNPSYYIKDASTNRRTRKRLYELKKT